MSMSEKKESFLEKKAQEAIAEAGMVKIQAQTMRAATPHLMPDSLVVAPTPTIDPVMVCVVDTGIPPWVARKRVNAPAVSAQKPP